MSPTDTASTFTLTMTRRLPAKRERVFAAISRAEDLRRWMCPADFTVRDAESDLRIGGRFRIEMRSPEGRVYIVSGAYLIIEPPRRLAFTWKWDPGHSMAGIETTVTIELTGQGSETLLVMTHADLPSEAERSGHERGWTGAYASLAELLGPEAMR